MRHSKSAYPLGVADHDRPLNERGVRDAQAASQWFGQQGFTLDEAWISSALRAQQTWSGIESGVRSASATPVLQRTVPSLYEASDTHLLSLLAGATVSRLLVVAHNPGLENLVHSIVGLDPHGWLAHISVKFPTGAVCVLRHEGWQTLASGQAELLTYAVPRAS